MRPRSSLWRRGARGALLLLPLTVFGGLARWLAAQDAALGLRRPGLEAEIDTSLPPLGPPARVVDGASVQGPFELLAVTRTGRRGLEPPVVLNARPTPLGAFVDTSVDGTGLWIGVRGGIGLQTCSARLDLPRQVFPVGDVTLVVMMGVPFSEYRLMWCGLDGMTPLDASQRPFEALAHWHFGRNERPDRLDVTLVPRGVTAQYAITAQPLTASGTPAGGPISLVCQPAAADALFVRLPAAYADRTRRMTVTFARRDAPAECAVWRLTDLPPARGNGPEMRPARTGVDFGTLSMRAAAVEAPDRTGEDDGWGDLPPPSGPGELLVTNADGHPWTGAPALRCRLRARVRPTASGVCPEWVIRIRRATPQWSPRPDPASALIRRRSLPRPADAYTVGHAPDTVWEDHDLQIGPTYPGQQRWLTLEGEVARAAYRYETVVLHDADVLYDATTRRWRVVWRHAQTVTTPSGVSVTALNARPGRAVPPGSLFLTPAGGAELLLAWHAPLMLQGDIPPEKRLDIPPDLGGDNPTSSTVLSLALPPIGSGPLRLTRDEGIWPDWHQVWVPDLPLPAPIRSLTGRMIAPPTAATPLGPFARAGWQPLRYAVCAGAITPRLRLVRAGSAAPSPRLPRHLNAVSLRIPLRTEVEHHPFTLVVPVTPHLPPGWETPAPSPVPALSSPPGA